MNKKISVIVPVYQVEQYLEKCIQSILHQSYRNLEIILIDDGSKDGCPAICDKYQMLDSRIKVVHKANGGLSSARNAGLNIATGEYITFVDSDDYIDERMIEVLLTNMQVDDSDISVCYWEKVRENGQHNSIWKGSDDARVERMTQVQAMEKMLYQRGCDACVYGKLFRRELLQAIRFPEKKIYEDIAIMYQVFGLAKRIVLFTYQGYFHLQRNTSINKSKFTIKKMSLIDFTKQNEQYVIKNYPQLLTAARSTTVRANFHIYLQIPAKAEYKVYRKRIEENIKARRKEILYDKESGIGIKAALLMTYLSFDFFYACKYLKNIEKAM